MVVKGIVSKTVDVEVSFENALRVIMKELVGVDIPPSDLTNFVVLEADDERNRENVKGIFERIDMSYHGSPDFKYYHLAVNDENAIETFEYIKKLYLLYMKNK